MCDFGVVFKTYNAYTACKHYVFHSYFLTKKGVHRHDSRYVNLYNVFAIQHVNTYYSSIQYIKYGSTQHCDPTSYKQRHTLASTENAQYKASEKNRKRDGWFEVLKKPEFG